MGVAPAYAMPTAIERAGLKPEEIDVCEVHEAFAAQALGVLRELPSQLGPATRSPTTSSTRTAVPSQSGIRSGDSGTRYVLYARHRAPRARGRATASIGVCVGSGQGVALVLENPNAA